MDFNKIDAMRDDILASLHELEFDKLKTQVENYSSAIKQTIDDLPNTPIKEADLKSIQQLLVNHQQLIKGFEYKRSNVLQELKKLKRGQVMQKTYPKP